MKGYNNNNNNTLQFPPTAQRLIQKSRFQIGGIACQDTLSEESQTQIQEQ